MAKRKAAAISGKAARRSGPARVGVIGCGVISKIYMDQMTQVFHNLEVAACADMLPERAEAKAAEYPGVTAMTVDDLLADKSIDIVVNLTIPRAHYEVAMAAVNAGKSVYNEKPLTITRKEGQDLLAAAKKNGVLVGGAPDTFLGGGLQTCRKLIDDGWIGEPVAATGFMMCRGPEGWHPDPEFYYKVGGGPMFDMGPYYLTAMISLLGPIAEVTGATRVTLPERIITSKAKYGTRIKVDVPTHIAGLMEFAQGAVGTIVTSFDVWCANLPRIEVYGTEGTLAVPDPNTFGGPVRIRRAGAQEWSEVPLTHIYGENSRGLGVADMALALEEGRQARAGGDLTYHVLDVMHAFHDAAEKRQHIKLQSSCKQPAPLPLGLLKGQVK